MPNTDPDPQTVALPPREAAVQLARKRFGFEGLRPGQLEAIDAVLSGQDVLVVMPTGAGKSAIYQIAALLLPGPTVVVSPLIALQRDQVLTLRESGAVSAAAANSTVRATDRRAALEDFQDDELELLFLAPEQLANSDTLQALGATNVSLLVVDEAHCISAWGHQFRPEYLRLGALADELGHPRVLALTATATPPVRAEILERLHMRDPVVLVRGFDRPNIGLAVRTFTEEDAKLADLLDGIPRGARAPLSTTNWRRVYKAAIEAAGADLAHLDLRGPHDLRHTFATWLEDAAIPSRVIDELMGHASSRRDRGAGGSPMGRVYRETTPAMVARVTAALDERIGRALSVAAYLLREGRDLRAVNSREGR